MPAINHILWGQGFKSNESTQPYKKNSHIASILGTTVDMNNASFSLKCPNCLEQGDALFLVKDMTVLTLKSPKYAPTGSILLQCGFQ